METPSASSGSERHPGGRPRLYHERPELLIEIEAHVRSGRSYTVATALADVPPTTWQRWRALAKAGDHELSAFMAKLDSLKWEARRRRRPRSFAGFVRDYLADLRVVVDADEDDPFAADDRSPFDEFLSGFGR